MAQVYTAMKLQRNKMQIFICASEALAQEEHDRYMAQRNAVKLHGLPGGLVLFEEIGRIKESAGSIDASYFLRNYETILFFSNNKK